MVHEFLGKKYRVVKHELFDEYMKALGVNFVLRKVGTSTMSEFLLTEKDGVYSLAITSTFRSQYLTFKLGEEFEETTLDGRKVKTTFTIDGNSLIQVQKGEKTTTIVRTFVGDEIRTTLSVDDIVSTMVSKLIE